MKKGEDINPRLFGTGVPVFNQNLGSYFGFGFSRITRE